MKRVVFAADASSESKLSQMMDSLKDDFDFILSGLEKLDRTGAEASNDGLIIAEGFQSYMQEIISNIGEKLV